MFSEHTLKQILFHSVYGVGNGMLSYINSSLQAGFDLAHPGLGQTDY